MQKTCYRFYQEGAWGRVRMVRIALVEDCAEYVAQLQGYLAHYQQESGEAIYETKLNTKKHPHSLLATSNHQ